MTTRDCRQNPVYPQAFILGENYVQKVHHLCLQITAQLGCNKSSSITMKTVWWRLLTYWRILFQDRGMCKTSKSSSVGMWSSQEEEHHQKMRRSIKNEHAASLNVTISRRKLKWKHYMQMEVKGTLQDALPNDLLKESRDLNYKQQSKKWFLRKASNSKQAELSKAHLAEQRQDMKLKCQVKLFPVASLWDSPLNSIRTALQTFPVWNHYIWKVTRKPEEKKELNVIQSLFFFLQVGFVKL